MEGNEAKALELHPDSFNSKIDFNSLVWRMMDRVSYQLTFGLNIRDLPAVNGDLFPSTRPAIFALKLSIQAFESTINPKMRLCDVKKKFLENKTLIFGRDFQRIENEALEVGRNFDQNQRLYIDILVNWYTLLCNQLPKIGLIRGETKTLSSNAGEE